MLVLGITGGVGSGKSRVLSYLIEQHGAVAVEMDAVGRELMEPEGACFEAVAELFPEAVVFEEAAVSGKCLDREGVAEESSGKCMDQEGIAEATSYKRLDRGKIAEAVFGKPERLAALNGVIHPAVRRVGAERMAEADAAGKPLFVMESAILVEAGYADICREVWYVYADAEVRKARLRQSRGYSDARTESVMASQLSEEAYMAGCDYRLDNGGDFAETAHAIDKRLKNLLRERP